MSPQLTEYQVQESYPVLLSNTHDVRSLKGCHNCRFNNWRLCTKVPPRDSASFYTANDCHDWQNKSA
jgi:hypothetical protein